MIRAALVAGSLLLFPSSPLAQDPAPHPVFEEPIGPFVVDARGVLSRFKANHAIAGALDVGHTDLPTRGLGLVVGGHVYPLRTRNFAMGLGGEILLRARGSQTISPVEDTDPDEPTAATSSVATSMTAMSPQVSLNFGRRNGWSYVSGGVGRASFTTELEDRPLEEPASRPMAINYGGGARWFAKKHLAFSIDIRFYAVRAQEATAGRPAFPRMTIMTM